MYVSTKDMQRFFEIRSKLRKMAIHPAKIESTNPDNIIEQTLLHERSMAFLNLTAWINQKLDDPVGMEHMLEWKNGAPEFTFLAPLIRAYENKENLTAYQYYEELDKANDRCKVFRNDAKEVLALRKMILKADPKFYLARKGIAEAIALMEEADKLNTVYMDHWQSTPGQVYACEDTMDEFHACGNKACLAGHIRLSKYFKEFIDFAVSPSPIARIAGNDTSAPVTVAALLDVPLWFANVMIYKHSVPRTGYEHEVHVLYGEPWRDIRASDILPVLKKLALGSTVESVFPKFD